jgi:hypothetical protein
MERIRDGGRGLVMQLAAEERAVSEKAALSPAAVDFFAASFTTRR